MANDEHPRLQAALQDVCKKLLAASPPDRAGDVYQTVIDTVERCLIDCALEHCCGNQGAAARLLGLHRNTLRRKLRTIV